MLCRLDDFEMCGFSECRAKGYFFGSIFQILNMRKMVKFGVFSVLLRYLNSEFSPRELHLKINKACSKCDGVKSINPVL